MGVRRARGSTLKPRPGTRVNAAWAAKWGLIASYPFWTGGGIIAEDASGHGNPGTLNNFASPPTATSGWNPGEDGPALAFVTDDYISVPDNSALSIVTTNQLTICLRINLSSVGQYILAKGNEPADQWEYAISTTGTSAVLVDIWTLAGAPEYQAHTGIGSVTTNAWYDFAFTVDHNAGVVRTYLNGEPRGIDDTPTGGTLGDGTSHLAIGRRNGSTYYDGLIGFVDIFNRALVPAQLMSLHIRPWQGFDHMLPFGVAAAAPAGNPWYYYAQM